MDNSMQNFKITLELETPFIMDRYTTLDSMLISEYFKITRSKGKNMEYSDDLSMIDFIDRRNGVLSGSIWYVPKDAPLRLDFTSFYKKPEHKKIFDLTSKYAKKAASEDFLTTDLKAFAMSEEIILTPEIYFYIRGSKKHIVRLLQNIRYVGKKRNIGFGMVNAFRMELTDKDKSFQLDDTTPSKPLPIEDFTIESKKITFYRAIPPYWSNRDLRACYMPSTALIEYKDNSSKDKKFKVLKDTSFESGLSVVASIISGKKGFKSIEDTKLEEDGRKKRWDVVRNMDSNNLCCLTNEKSNCGIAGVSNYMRIKKPSFPALNLFNDNDFLSQKAIWGMTIPIVRVTADSIVMNNEIKKVSQSGSEEGYRFKDYIKNPYMLKPPFILMRTVSSTKPEHVVLGSRKALSNALYPIQYAEKTHYVDSELLLQAVEDVREILKEKAITKSHLLGLWRDKKHPTLGKNETRANRLIIEKFQKKYDKAIRMSLFSVVDFSQEKRL